MLTGPVLEPDEVHGQDVGTRLREEGQGKPLPPEVWDHLGTKLLPKLRSGSELKVGVEFSVTLEARLAASLVTELRQALLDLGLEGRIRIE